VGQNGIHPACTCAIDVCYGGFVVVKKVFALWNEYIVCLVSVSIVLDFLNLSHYYGIQALKTDSVEQRFMANTAEKVVDDLFWMEGSPQGINAFTAASADRPRKIAMQTTLRASAKSLAMVITEMRLANDWPSTRRCVILRWPRSMRCSRRSS